MSTHTHPATPAKRRPTRREHPAPFSDRILATIAARLVEQGPLDVLVDPFAGTGRVHDLRHLASVARTIGVELEPEWAAKHPDTICGDALRLREVLASVGVAQVDAVCTSPTYANRLADHHEARDDSVRLTYRHTLGRPLTDGNAGALQWGERYRVFHIAAWAEAVAVLRPGGVFVLNVKNHIRRGVEQRVVEWHVDELAHRHGLELLALDAVPTRGLAVGANATTRTPAEIVATFRKPASGVHT
jgi:hypothetical protein